MNEQDSPLFSYDPDSLADRLDALFPPDSDFVSDAGVAEPEPLIDIAGRLAAAPKLEPSAEALARIQARMNAAIPTPESPPQPAKPRPILRWPVIVLAAAAVMALTLVVVGRLVTTRDETRDQVAQQSTETAVALVILTETSTTAVPTTAVPTVAATDEATIASTSTPEIVPTEPTATPEAVTQATEIPTTPPTTQAASPTPSEVPATVTDTATATTVIIVAPTDTVVVTQVMVVSPSFTPSPVDTVEPAITLPPTAVATAVDTVEPAPTMTPTPLPGHLILEGQIGAIEANVIDIYGIKVSVDEDDPLLQVLRVDDFVRVEGSFEDVDGLLIVEVFTIELVTEDGEGIDVIVNPSDPDEVWRDSGDCSNPPPPWAPAVGWRRRCENTGSPGNPGNPGNPGGPGGPGNPDPGKPGNPPGKPDIDD